MPDQYRYQKKYQHEKNRPLKSLADLITVQKKLLLASSFILVGVLILGYLTLYYSSYILATTENQLSSPLVRAKNDFVGFNQTNVLGVKKDNLVYRNFTISISSLKIKAAQVTTNIESSKKETYLPVLEESIAHFKGTSLPGQEGDGFLYGHSVLPQFFNSNDYLTIFSTLHKVKIGDEVQVKYGDSDYKYVVYDKEVVDPKDLDVVNKSGEGEKTMTLMTCSPPGTTLKRLLVSTRLIE